MIAKRTDSADPHFQDLVTSLDLELKIRDQEEHAFLAGLNKTDYLKYAIVVYNNGEPVGCGALREYSPGVVEIKRMFVPVDKRRLGIASTILNTLETWCRELNFKKCILETGKNQPETINFYKKNEYCIIPNFGQYEHVENSVCFEKDLSPEV